MLYLLLPLMFLSHALAMRGFWKSLRQGVFPHATQSVPASFILYYDLGLLAELCGYTYEVRYFTSIFRVDETQQLIAVGLIGFGPWLVLAGARLVQDCSRRSAPIVPLRLTVGSQLLFYSVSLFAVSLLAWIGYSHIGNGQAIWEVRQNIGEDYGFMCIMFYIPLQLLAFFVTTRDARGLFGTLFTVGLVLGSCVTTVCLGQRTLLLLPALIVLFFRFRPTPGKVVAALSLPIVAACMLTAFKGHFASSGLRTDELVVQTVHIDFSRTGILLKALELSEPVGTRALPYPGSGYVYTALFTIPRTIVPFKGHSTAHEFTALIMGEQSNSLTWGFAVGMVEELVLNAGLWPCLGGLVVWGMIVGMLDRLADSIRAMRVPLSIGCLFLCGYDSSALLLMYGLMAIMGALLEFCFACACPAPSERSSQVLTKPRWTNGQIASSHA